jgi:hypothetical protein
VHRVLTSDQLRLHLVFLANADRADLDELLTMLLSTAWPSTQGQMS